jgi:tripartite-type tricarboxylate transporter receptor subunit TctC
MESSKSSGLRRRELLAGVAGAAAPLGAAWAQADPAYPSKPIRVLVGFPPGGAIDVLVRVISQRASAILGQPIVIENRPGASGTVSVVQMKNAAPDGYTLGILTITVFRAPVLEDVAYDPGRDITYIAGLSSLPFGIVVRADSPYRSWQELLAAGRARPEGMNYGVVGGLGQSGHLIMEEMTRQEGVKWNPVPYRGGPETEQAVLAGDVPFALDGTGSFAPFLDAKRVRVLALVGSERFDRWPDVPTTVELGYPQTAGLDGPWGIGGPRGIDPKAVQVLQSAFLQALESPDVRAAMQRSAVQPRPMTHREYTSYAERTVVDQRALLTKFGMARKR